MSGGEDNVKCISWIWIL